MAETEDKSEPLQYHYVVWGELRDGKIEWTVDIEAGSALMDGSVYDPNGTGWRTLNEDEEEIDNSIFAALCDRLKDPSDL